MTSPVRVTVPRPPQPTYIPGRCYALKTPDDTSTHCMAEGARLYPIGWRCDDCAPGAHKTSRETSANRTNPKEILSSSPTLNSQLIDHLPPGETR